MIYTNTQIENELQRIADLTSRLSYEMIEIHNNFCVEGFLLTSDHELLNSIGNKLILVIEKEISKLDRFSEKLTKKYHKLPEIK
jgi:hypothetical protein